MRGKLKYRPIVFELLEPSFTVLSAGLVEPTGQVESGGACRPAELFRYQPAAIHERSSAHSLRDDDADS